MPEGVIAPSRARTAERAATASVAPPVPHAAKPRTGAAIPATMNSAIGSPRLTIASPEESRARKSRRFAAAYASIEPW